MLTSAQCMRWLVPALVLSLLGPASCFGEAVKQLDTSLSPAHLLSPSSVGKGLDTTGRANAHASPSDPVSQAKPAPGDSRKLEEQMKKFAKNGGAHDVRTNPGPHVDVANVIVVVIATILLAYSAHRALHPPFMEGDAANSVGIGGGDQDDDVGEVKLSQTFMFVLVSSASLLLLFYFMSAMSVLISILFSLVSTLSLTILVYPYVDRATNFRFNKEFEIPVLGEVTMLGMVLTPICGTIVLAWLLTHYWLLNNLLAVSLVVFFLTSIRLSSIKVGAALLVLAFFYDIFWVFVSSSVFGSNVMVTVATKLDVPIKILVPLVVHTPSSQFTLIGLGDIVLPGLMVCFALRVDHAMGISGLKGYFAKTLAGYAISLMVCEIIVSLLRVAQPAMIYLVPGVLGTFVVAAYRRGDFASLWEGLSDAGHQPIADSSYV